MYHSTFKITFFIKEICGNFVTFLLVRIVQAVQAHRRIVSASSTFHESKKNKTKEEGEKMEPILHMKGKKISPNIFFRFGRFQGPREKMPLFCQHDTPRLEFPLFSVSFYSGDRESVTAREKEEGKRRRRRKRRMMMMAFNRRKM